MPFADRAGRQRPDRHVRLVPSAVMAAVIIATLSGASVINRDPVLPIAPLSLAMQAEGERLAALGAADAATGYFETALAADPRNTAAFIGMGRIARTQGLTGKAIVMFRGALATEPDNIVALSGEADAHLARGAIDEARRLAAHIRTLCGFEKCPEHGRLETAFENLGEKVVLTIDDIRPQPVASAN